MGRGGTFRPPLDLVPSAIAPEVLDISYAVDDRGEQATWVVTYPKGQPKPPIKDFLITRAPYRAGGITNGSLCLVPIAHAPGTLDYQALSCASDVRISPQAFCEDCQLDACVHALCASALGNNSAMEKAVKDALDISLTEGEEMLPFGTLSHGHRYFTATEHYPYATRFHLQPGQISINFLLRNGLYRIRHFNISDTPYCPACNRTRCTEWDLAKATASYDSLSDFIHSARAHAHLGRTTGHLQARLPLMYVAQEGYEVRISFSKPGSLSTHWSARLVGPGFKRIALNEGTLPCKACPKDGCGHAYLYDEMLRMSKAGTLDYFTT